MKRTVSIFRETTLIAVILSIAFSVSYSQQRERRYDPRDVEVTRWLDPTIKPTTFEEYVAGRDFAGTPRIRLLSAPVVTTDYLVDIIVNEDLYPDISASLDTFMADLGSEGYSVNLYMSNETMSPLMMRNVLYEDWIALDLRGVILVGDLTIPWYEMYEPSGWGGAHVEFPCDLYFMDLNGIWGDSDSDGMFDSHSGELLADIWVGRLVASCMTDHFADEAALLRNYFNKNHRYRTGELRMDDHALAFIDNDWNMYGWGYDVAMAYPDMDSLVALEDTYCDNYIEHVRESSDNAYEHVLICAHSTPIAHWIVDGDYGYNLFHNYEIEDFMMQSFSYNLFACSNSRFVENDNMGGWYIYETRYGLLTVGTTKTGSMLCFDDFYAPLGVGSNFGDALVHWAQIDMETCADEDSRAWFYGTCIQGDPTLKLGRFQAPPPVCEYEPGDYNGSGVVNVADVVAAFSKLKTGSPDPALLCECPSGSGIEWAVAADVNNSCDFNIADVIVTYSKLCTGSPNLVPCEDCPPH